MATGKVMIIGAVVLLATAAAGTEEPIGNNLSYPAVFTAGFPDEFEWSPYEPALLGVRRFLTVSIDAPAGAQMWKEIGS